MTNTPALTECLALTDLVKAVDGSRAHYPSPYHTYNQQGYTEYRAPLVTAQLTIVEGDGGDSLTARIGETEYVIVLDVEQFTRREAPATNAQYTQGGAQYTPFLTAQEAYAFAAGAIYMECQQEGRVYKGIELIHGQDKTYIKCAASNAEYFLVTMDDKGVRLHPAP